MEPNRRNLNCAQNGSAQDITLLSFPVILSVVSNCLWCSVVLSFVVLSSSVFRGMFLDVPLLLVPRARGVFSGSPDHCPRSTVNVCFYSPTVASLRFQVSGLQIPDVQVPEFQICRIYDCIDSYVWTPIKMGSLVWQSNFCKSKSFNIWSAAGGLAQHQMLLLTETTTSDTLFHALTACTK